MWNDTAPGRFWLPGPFLIPSSPQRGRRITRTNRVKFSE